MLSCICSGSGIRMRMFCQSAAAGMRRHIVQCISGTARVGMRVFRTGYEAGPDMLLRTRGSIVSVLRIDIPRCGIYRWKFLGTQPAPPCP